MSERERITRARPNGVSWPANSRPAASSAPTAWRRWWRFSAVLTPPTSPARRCRWTAAGASPRASLPSSLVTLTRPAPWRTASQCHVSFRSCVVCAASSPAAATATPPAALPSSRAASFHRTDLVVGTGTVATSGRPSTVQLHRLALRSERQPNRRAASSTRRSRPGAHRSSSRSAPARSFAAGTRASWACASAAAAGWSSRRSSATARQGRRQPAPFRRTRPWFRYRVAERSGCSAEPPAVFGRPGSPSPGARGPTDN